MSKSEEPRLTPMMAQYRQIKAELPKDALLLFRLGDFYELFFEDATEGAGLLNVTLTRRQDMPMCGIPYHAANAYISRLLKAGKKVAICDQTEEAKPGQLVRREVTQILSPGTHFDERMLTAERNNFLGAVYQSGGTYGLAFIDLTTGDFKTTEANGEAELLTELERLRPAEIICPGEAGELMKLLRGSFKIVAGYDDWTFAPETAVFTLKDHFKVAALDGFGLKGHIAASGAAGGALHYLTNHLRRDVKHLTSLSFYLHSEFLKLDHVTLRHLEILEPMHRDSPRNATLYGALNRTTTPMGARRLRDWLTQPLASVEAIVRRQEAVASFVDSSATLEALRGQLREVRDVERTISRLSAGTGNARDLLALRLALEKIPTIKQVLSLVGRGAGRDQARDSFHKLREPGPDEWRFQPCRNDVFGPVFDQFQGRTAEAIAWLCEIETGEALGALVHPEVGAIDLVWGTATGRGSGFGLAKITRWHPEMLPQIAARVPAMTKLRETENSILLADPGAQAVVKLNAFGTPKRWLLTAYEKGGPAPAGRTIDVSSDVAAHRQTPAPRDGPDGKLDSLHEDVNGPPEEPNPLLLFAARQTGSLLTELSAQLTELPELVDLISRAISDEPPLALKEGGLIRDGFDAALDELRAATRGGKDWIAKLQQDEIERTGISSLKVRFNSVFGYFIEVTKSNLDKVPAEYVRKQTIANGERYFTPALKEMESKILGAEERSTKLEYELFQRVREDVLLRLAEIQRTAAALAQLDVLGSFAETARLYNYVRPEVGNEGILLLRDGRHPVLEQTMTDQRFVPNDTELNFGRADLPVSPDISSAQQHGPTGSQIMLITGPNMAGKSTYIRQVALLGLLAHTGSFLPAASARVDLIDRIFTRIGASDDLARGQSTFMVEMSETANILNNATQRSLVILDEIGRGTSTFDGLSLAWSIVEHLHNQVGAKTLFATHYHELTELTGKLKRLKNHNVAVREWNDQIVFLHKIVEGGTDKSYGIQVARLAGVPKEVIERAKVILRNLEESELTPEGNVRRARRQEDREKLKQIEAGPQMDLFG